MYTIITLHFTHPKVTDQQFTIVIPIFQVSLQAKNKLMAQMEAQMAHKYEHSMMNAAATSADPSATDYSQYWQSQYGQNWSQYAAWSQYYQQYYDPNQANSAYYG